jgi:hypothetical protein
MNKVQVRLENTSIRKIDAKHEMIRLLKELNDQFKVRILLENNNHSNADKTMILTLSEKELFQISGQFQDTFFLLPDEISENSLKKYSYNAIKEIVVLIPDKTKDLD